jgi:RNA polymerase sigma-70 factor (ECF subfamily)
MPLTKVRPDEDEMSSHGPVPINGVSEQMVTTWRIRHRVPANRVESYPREVIDRLIERAKAGDTDAFGELYLLYFDTIYQFTLSRVHNRALAEDLTSDVFVRALGRITSFVAGNIGGWLMAIAKNRVTDWFRSPQFKREWPMSGTDMRDASTPDQSMEADPEQAVINRHTLMQAIDGLYPDQRRCIVLRFLRGHSVIEIARLMNRTPGAVKMLQFRALRRLGRWAPAVTA